MKKNDLILILVICIITAASFAVYGFIFNEEGVSVIVSIDGKEYKILSLNEDTILDIPGDAGVNCLEIKNGYVNMLSASCPDQICVYHKEIHCNKETIVCLPGKIVIEIRGGQLSGIDAVAY